MTLVMLLVIIYFCLSVVGSNIAFKVIVGVKKIIKVVCRKIEHLQFSTVINFLLVTLWHVMNTDCQFINGNGFIIYVYQ